MSEMTIKELLNLLKNWPRIIGEFYKKIYESIDDVSFRRLITTMIDQEGEYKEYFEENLGKLDLKQDFGSKLNDLFSFEILPQNISDISGLSKVDFLMKAVHFHEISISNCELLGSLSNTDSGRQIFKEFTDEEHRHMMILKDRLELEELF